MVKKIIDISKHQGTIDFSKVKDEVEFVIIRVQYGSNLIDSKYKEYVSECKKYKIPFGHYAYFRAVNTKDAEVEAKDFLARADEEAKFLVVDVEEVTTTKKSDLIPATQAFIDYLKANDKKKRKIGLYTGHSFFYEQNMDKVKDYSFLWIPRYASNKPSMKCDLWQYTDSGKVSGIKGNVDCNYLNSEKGIEWFIGTTTKKTAKKKTYALPSGVLKKGDKGSNVLLLQKALNALSFKVEEDSIFGSETEEKLKNFQKVYLPFEVDGIYGQDTKKMIQAQLKKL